MLSLLLAGATVVHGCLYLSQINKKIIGPRDEKTRLQKEKEIIVEFFSDYVAIGEGGPARTCTSESYTRR